MSEEVHSKKHSFSRRRFVGASALGAAGWVAGGGGWMLAAKPACAADPVKMGIATDITGAIAPSGNANWQVAQFTVEQINKAGGIGGRQIELYLEDTASDPKIAVGNVRKLIQERKVNVVLGGITSAMRQAIKDPIVNRGRTLYIYPQLYEGQECTKFLYCTGPTPAQQCDKLIPYLIKTVGKKRFAMPSANYVWPQLLNKYARKVIEANGGEVVFEEYYPLDQAEYSATIGKIRDGKVDCVFNTVIPPGLQPFVKQLYEDLLLALEILVERGARGARRLGNAFHRRGVEALRLEQPKGFLDYPLTSACPTLAYCQAGRAVALPAEGLVF